MKTSVWWHKTTSAMILQPLKPPPKNTKPSSPTSTRMKSVCRPWCRWLKSLKLRTTMTRNASTLGVCIGSTSQTVSIHSLDTTCLPWRFMNYTHCYCFNFYSTALFSQLSTALQISFNRINSSCTSRNKLPHNHAIWPTGRKDNVLRLWEYLLELLRARRMRLDLSLQLQRIFEEMICILELMDDIKVASLFSIY